MNRIMIDGEVYKGDSIVVKDGKVMVDGFTKASTKGMTIVINGSLDRVSIDHANSVTINGDVLNASSIYGNIHVSSEIRGDAVSNNGNISANLINGDCKTVTGNILRKR